MHASLHSDSDSTKNCVTHSSLHNHFESTKTKCVTHSSLHNHFDSTRNKLCNAFIITQPFLKAQKQNVLRIHCYTTILISSPVSDPLIKHDVFDNLIIHIWLREWVIHSYQYLWFTTPVIYYNQFLVIYTWDEIRYQGFISTGVTIF